MNSKKNLQWLEDVNCLATELPRKHKNLFFKKTKTAFLKEIDTIKADIANLTDYEIKLEIAKIIASIGDAHTFVPLQINLLLPLEFYWFSDGIYVINASLEYKNILYCKIIKINQIPIDEVICRLKTIISYENETYLKSQLPKYLPAIELLYDLGIVNDIGVLEITFEDKSRKVLTIDIASLPLKESKETLSITSKILDINTTLPLYRSYSDKIYWFEYIPTQKIIYFKYDACKDMLSKNVSTFCDELIQFINEHHIEKLVIDLRNNFGGNSSLLDPFIKNIKHCSKINKKGKLFVIIGRETFSSALLNAFSLKKNTFAIFIGEPTGGKPNCYGEVQRFKLKNSGLIICYSTEYYKIIEDDFTPSLIPDVNLLLSIQDYMSNEDPCLNYIINN